MKFRDLGQSGLRVSVVGLGCNNFGARTDAEGSRAVIDQAIDSGITLFDTADIYGDKGGSETILGDVLGARRKQIVLATKFAGEMTPEATKKNASREYIMSAVEASLQRLKTDWIDLYQLHFPDPETPMEETLRALDDVVRQGKVRYLGISNHSAWQVVDALWIAKTKGLIPFASCQEEYSLLVRDVEKEMIPAMRTKGLGLLPYFPLASGMLTGKYQRGQEAPTGTRFAASRRLQERYMSDRNWQIVEGLTKFAESRGHTILDLAFSWLLAQEPVSSVIAGATKPEQIEANIRAGEWELNATEIEAIKTLLA
jgi:aryl-alcohol dehydrogenase-like predicted oxidoreductase